MVKGRADGHKIAQVLSRGATSRIVVVCDNVGEACPRIRRSWPPVPTVGAKVNEPLKPSDLDVYTRDDIFAGPGARSRREDVGRAQPLRARAHKHISIKNVGPERLHWPDSLQCVDQSWEQLADGKWFIGQRVLDTLAILVFRGLVPRNVLAKVIAAEEQRACTVLSAWHAVSREKLLDILEAIYSSGVNAVPSSKSVLRRALTSHCRVIGSIYTGHSSPGTRKSNAHDGVQVHGILLANAKAVG